MPRNKIQFKMRKLPKKIKFRDAQSRAKTAFQLYVRVRDSNKAGYAKCCYCGFLRGYKQMQGAHYLKSFLSSVTFDEMNCHPSCPICNYRDDHSKYREFVVKKYGLESVEKLEFKAKMICKRTTSDLLYLEKFYKDQTKLLLEEKQ